MAYDALNRLTAKSSSGSCGTQVSTTYIYDAGTNGIGKRTRMNDASGYTEWTYDLRGRLATEKKTITGAGTFQTAWTYYSNDAVRTMTYPDGESVSYEYLPQGALQKINGAANYVPEIQYDAAGRMNLLKLGSALQTEYTYFPWNTPNGVGRLQEIRSRKTSDNSVLLQLAYTYDKNGNIETIVDTPNSQQKQCFGYDALDRLTSAKVGNSSCSGSAGNGEYPDELYAYNAQNGNLASRAGVTYAYNSTHKHAVTHLNGVQKYWYDANGNMTKRIAAADTFEFAYDAENRLVQVKKNGVVLATFTYDGDGNRVKSVLNSQTTLFIGEHYEKEGNLVTKYYFAGTQRVAMRQGSTVHYLLSDHLGSTSVVYNASTGTAVTQLYKPWGEVRYSSAALPTKYTYTGQYNNTADFGLMYYRARWYDPSLGRFAQADTIVPLASQGSQAWDRYAGMNNNPVRYTDPSGHCIDPDECESTDSENPFDYPTLALGAFLNIKKIPGLQVGFMIYANYGAIKESFENLSLDPLQEFDVSVNVEVTFSAGISYETDAMAVFKGTDGSVDEQSGFSVIQESSVPVNLGVCVVVACGKVTSTFDLSQDDDPLTAIAYSGGVPIEPLGVDISADLFGISYPILRSSHNETSWNNLIFFADELSRDWSNIWP